MIAPSPPIISLLSLLLVLNSALTFAGEEGITWIDNLELARNLAASSNKLVLIHFYSTNCPPCARLEQKVFSQAVVGHAMSQQFVPVQVNVGHFPKIAKQYGIDRWPSDVLLSPQGVVLHRQISPSDSINYMNMLRKVVWRHDQGVQDQPSSFAPKPETEQPINQQSFNQLPPASSSSSDSINAMAAHPTMQQPPQTAPLHSMFPNRETKPKSQLQTSSSANSYFPTGLGVPMGPANNQLPPNACVDPQMVTNQYCHPGPNVQSAAEPYQTADETGQSRRPLAMQSLKTVYNDFATGIGQPATIANPHTDLNPRSQTISNSAVTPPEKPVVHRRQVHPTTPTIDEQPARGVGQQWLEPQHSISTVALARETPHQQITANVNQNAIARALTVTGVPPADEQTDASANPPTTKFGLDGYCPVTLIELDEWQLGNERWRAHYRGRLYLFTTPAAQQSFLNDPDRYSPVLAGFDPVVFQTDGDYIDGFRQHGVRFYDQVFLFSSEETLKQFWKNPSQYVEPIRRAMAATALR